MAHRVSRPLEVQVRFAEVPVRVTGAVSRLSGWVRVQDRVVVLVIRLDLVVVQVEAALLLRVRQEAEAEVAAHHRQAPRVMEVETFLHRPRRDRRVRLTTLLMFRMELGLETLRISGVR